MAAQPTPRRTRARDDTACHRAQATQSAWKVGVRILEQRIAHLTASDWAWLGAGGRGGCGGGVVHPAQSENVRGVRVFRNLAALRLRPRHQTTSTTAQMTNNTPPPAAPPAIALVLAELPAQRVRTHQKYATSAATERRKEKKKKKKPQKTCLTYSAVIGSH